MTVSEILADCIGFQWDDGNTDKDWGRHGVTWTECEQAFFSDPLIAASDRKHSQDAPRYFVLGRTSEGRRLFVVCTVRMRLIRVISARTMSRRERRIYEQATKEVSD